MNKEPTATSVVLAELQGADDFMTMRQLREHTRLNINQVSAALHHLRVHKCVEFISDGSGVWWYATPESDTRLCAHDQRAPETRPRRQRKSKSDILSGVLNSPYGCMKMIFNGRVWPNGTPVKNNKIVGETLKHRVPDHWITKVADEIKL